jgi:hypothetical protein
MLSSASRNVKMLNKCRDKNAMQLTLSTCKTLKHRDTGKSPSSALWRWLWQKRAFISGEGTALIFLTPWIWKHNFPPKYPYQTVPYSNTWERVCTAVVYGSYISRGSPEDWNVLYILCTHSRNHYFLTVWCETRSLTVRGTINRQCLAIGCSWYLYMSESNVRSGLFCM